MMQEATIGKRLTPEPVSDCLIGSHKCLLLFTPPVAGSAFLICSGLCACTEMW